MSTKSTIFPLIVAGVVMSGCSSTRPETERLTVVIPSAIMYDCPIIRKADLSSIETEEQAQRLLVKAVSNNWKCRNSIDAIKRFLNESKQRIEKTS